jgi:hypothetical protein
MKFCSLLALSAQCHLSTVRTHMHECQGSHAVGKEKTGGPNLGKIHGGETAEHSMGCDKAHAKGSVLEGLLLPKSLAPGAERERGMSLAESAKDGAQARSGSLSDPRTDEGTLGRVGAINPEKGSRSITYGSLRSLRGAESLASGTPISCTETTISVAYVLLHYSWSRAAVVPVTHVLRNAAT